MGSLQSTCIRDRRRITAVGESPFVFNGVTVQAPIDGKYEMDSNFLGVGLGFGGQGRAQLGCGALCGHIGYESHFYYEVVGTAQDNRNAQGRPSNLQVLTANAGFGGLTTGLAFSY